MTKTITTPMQTHLDLDVTTISMAVVITRTDGTKIRLTTSSENVSIDVGDGDGIQVFTAAEGFRRTNIQNDAELTVNNMEVLGVFDDMQLDELDLRRGIYDFADVKIFLFNHQDTSSTMGIIKQLRGQFGEVVVTPQGFFKVELRSLEQVYSQEIEERYSKDCRADLGDLRCAVPIFPDLLPINTSISVGDFYRIPATPDINDCSQIILNFEGTDGSTIFNNEGTQGNPDQVAGDAQVDTAEFFAGVSSLRLDGTGDILRWFDANWNDIGPNPFTIQARIRLDATGVTHTIFSKYEATTSDRVFRFQVNSSDVLFFQWFLDGISSAGTITGTTTLSTGTWYHVAVTRDVSGDTRVFLNGTQEGSTVNETGSYHNSDERLRIGAIESAGETSFFDGWIDSFEFLNGAARWTTTFSPPTGLLPAVSDFEDLIWEDFDDVIYEVTTAGFTNGCIETPDTLVGNTHNQGTAVLTANNSWMRFAEVVAVDGTQPRRKFTVTELTPNTGEAVGANRTPSSLGFPNDWFNGGAVLFETGVNTGRAIEVRDFIADDGITIEQDIELFTDMPFDIEVGDKLRVFPGCDKTQSTCINKFNNAINAVAEWFTSTPDIFGQYPDAR